MSHERSHSRRSLLTVNAFLILDVTVACYDFRFRGSCKRSALSPPSALRQPHAGSPVGLLAVCEEDDAGRLERPP